jgi:anaerobic selenocysteine-containing dehydrogenase
MEPISRRSLFAGVCAVVALAGSEVPAAANAAVKKLPGGKLSVKSKRFTRAFCSWGCDANWLH